MLDIKNLIFKEKLAKKLVDQYVSHYEWCSFYQYSQITTANFNENLPSCECQLSSKI